jgi:hypothetical protein
MSTGTGLIITLDDLRRGEGLASTAPQFISLDVLIISGFFRGEI